MDSEIVTVTISRDLLGRIKVKRDMEVVRKVLKAIQDKPDLTPREISVDGVDEVTAAHHIALLHEAGFLNGSRHQPIGKPLPRILVVDLTWEGHDFIAALANDTVWAKIKKALSPADLAAMPLDVLKKIGKELLEEFARGQISNL